MSKPSSWSLAYVIPSLILLIFIAIQGVIITVEYSGSRERLLEQANQEIRGDIAKLQQTLSDALMRHDTAVAERELTLTSLNANIKTLVAIDENAEIILANRLSWKYMFAQSVLDEFSWDKFHLATGKHKIVYDYLPEQNLIQVYAPLQLALKDNSMQRNNYGAIYINYSLARPFNNLLYQSLQSSAKTFAIVALAMLVLTLLLTHLVIRPLNRLAGATKLVDFGHDSMLLPKGQGEIGQLQQAFFKMSKTVESSFSQLRESEQRWHYALSGARDGVWDWNMESGEVFFSPRWKEMLGYTDEEISPDIEEWERRIHPDDLFDTFAALKSHLSGKQPFFENIHRLRCKGGSYRWILDRGKVIEWAENGVPSRIIGTHTDITEYREAQEKVRFQAYHDEITQLPNRRQLLEKLDEEMLRAQHSGLYGGLLFIDLDHFKHVNDLHGHDAGDMLLQMVAKRLQQSKSKADFVSRLTGDEFVVILPDLHKDKEKAVLMTREFGETVKTRIKSPFVVKGHRVNLACSIGISLFPYEECDANDVLRQADIAMYHGKEEGQDKIHFFCVEMENKVHFKHQMQQMLRLAIEQDEISLFLQPRIDDQRRVVGCEALMRWKQPDKGWITPSDFVPIAEDSGLILPLGSWVLRKSCELLSLWRQAGLPAHFRTLSVNISPKQFHQSGFVDEVKRIVKESGIDPCLLELELTERVLLVQMDEAVEKIEQLRKLGIRFAIDDFGTGYSSMSYLSTLPITALKIDKSFVINVEHKAGQQAIVSAIIAMAENLNLDIIAEGVENVEQLNFLQLKGCRLYQGFYFGKPLEEEVFMALLQQAKPIEVGTAE